MTLDPLPPDEAALHAEVAALDMEALRPTFDRLARLAQTITGAPIAQVALTLETEVWTTGVTDEPIPMRVDRSTVDGMWVASGEVAWIADALDVPVLKHSPYVTGSPHMRFYAAAPVTLESGVVIGALYVIDRAPRTYDAHVAEGLKDLADLVAHECERPRLQRKLADAEAAARASAQVIAGFVESSPVALMMTDQDLRVMHVSPQWRADMGMERIDVTGKLIGEVFPNLLPTTAAAFDVALAGQVVRAPRTQLKLPNGKRPWVKAEVTPWMRSDGKIGGILSMTHDITDMVVALQEAERSQQRLALAAEIAGLHVWEMDYVNRILRKEGAEDTFFDETQTFGKLKKDMWHTIVPEDREGAIAKWQDCQERGEPYRHEYRLVRKDGQEVWCFGGSEMVLGPDGQVRSVIGVMQNITARKAGERAIAQARDAAEAANRAKSEFLANMSHEIRTPLNGVMGVAGALSRTKLKRDQRDMVRLVETSAQTLESLLSDVLDLARIESGRLSLKVEPFNLVDAVTPVTGLFAPTAVAKGLAFDVEIAPEAQGAFEGDVARVRQILSNMISNAVKFTAEGSVRVSVDVEPAEDGARLTFAVKDSGIGFDAATRDRLFERFEQADGSITRRFGGTGLGLAISRSLARAMDGDLTAEATPGEGARFVFSVVLPRAAAAAPKPRNAAPPPPSKSAAGTPRILLAEDHPINRRVVELILGGLDVDLTCVENGQEAVDAYRRQRFDLILMDMQMPVMDGLTAIREIRALERKAGDAPTPIYSLTANAMPEHAEASRQAGADAHLTKPITAEALIAAVETVCCESDAMAEAMRA
jgi:PAS domain S-box-containing protein